jgi:diphthamide biosynthesis protein 4
MNAYEILECRRDSSPDEIKASYHRLLLVHHPDKQSGCVESDSSSKIDAFLKLHSAYRLLSDATERPKYDSLLRQTELKDKANEMEDNSNLLLEQDFEHDELGCVYTRRCRCGDNFSIGQQEINTLLKNILTCSADSLLVCLECNTCSIVISVLII